MPVLNGETHVADQLAGLSAQTYAGAWELVVADNGCSDRTIGIVESWRPRLPSLTIANARARRGLNHARNAGARAARGDFLAFCDADDVAGPDWLEAMAEAATGADIVGGRLEWEALNDPVVRAWRPQAPMTDLLVGHGFLRYAPGDRARPVGFPRAPWPLDPDRLLPTRPPGRQPAGASALPVSARPLHLLEVGINWPPETFLCWKLEGLAAKGLRVTVASRAISDPDAGLEGVELHPLPQGRQRPSRVAVMRQTLRLLVTAPRRLLALLREIRRTDPGFRRRYRGTFGMLALYLPVAGLLPGGGDYGG